VPLPNFHSCRLRNPDDFQKDSFRTVERAHNGKQYSVIMGKLTGKSSITEQAYRYKKDTWSVSEARSHCDQHGGSFTPAGKSEGALKLESKVDALLARAEVFGKGR
jgi:hypothetical protein